MRLRCRLTVYDPKTTFDRDCGREPRLVANLTIVGAADFCRTAVQCRGHSRVRALDGQVDCLLPDDRCRELPIPHLAHIPIYPAAG